jgi:homoserine acetyltransferase
VQCVAQGLAGRRLLLVLDTCEHVIEIAASMAEAALAAIKARTIVLPVDLDHYFPPEDSEYEARHVPNGECRAINSEWGHMAPMNVGDIPAIDKVLAEPLQA